MFNVELYFKGWNSACASLDPADATETVRLGPEAFVFHGAATRAKITDAVRLMYHDASIKEVDLGGDMKVVWMSYCSDPALNAVCACGHATDQHFSAGSRACDLCDCGSLLSMNVAA